MYSIDGTKEREEHEGRNGLDVHEWMHEHMDVHRTGQVPIPDRFHPVKVMHGLADPQRNSSITHKRRADASAAGKASSTQRVSM